MNDTKFDRSIIKILEEHNIDKKMQRSEKKKKDNTRILVRKVSGLWQKETDFLGVYKGRRKEGTYPKNLIGKYKTQKRKRGDQKRDNNRSQNRGE